MYNSISIAVVCNTCVHWLLFIWHGITKGSTLVTILNSWNQTCRMITTWSNKKCQLQSQIKSMFMSWLAVTLMCLNYKQYFMTFCFIVFRTFSLLRRKRNTLIPYIKVVIQLVYNCALVYTYFCLQLVYNDSQLYY